MAAACLVGRPVASFLPRRAAGRCQRHSLQTPLQLLKIQRNCTALTAPRRLAVCSASRRAPHSPSSTGAQPQRLLPPKSSRTRHTSRALPSGHLNSGRADWRDAVDAEEDGDAWSYLSDDEVDELLDDAAGFIGVMDELTPLDRAAYNPLWEVWTRVARIPPEERHRLLDLLSAGSLRSLWRASLGRYTLDAGRALQLFSAASVWDDFPREPGQVFEYEGRCETYDLGSGPGGGARVTLTADAARQAAADSLAAGGGGGGSAAWLRPSVSAVEVPVRRFRQQFFVPGAPLGAEGGEGAGAGRASLDEEFVPPPIHGRVLLPLLGPLYRAWEPLYCRVHVELTLTPLPADAGADILFLYPADPLAQEQEEQDAGDDGEGEGEGSGALFAPLPLPSPLWPAPQPAAYPVSPFGGGTRDYVRVAGPGLYVGCAYREGPGRGEYRPENCVYFALVRRWQ